MHISVLFRQEWPLNDFIDYAHQAEQVGFQGLWLAEDAFLSGGISVASAALAATENLHVGLGLMPAVIRNPLFAAMEIASVATLFPQRFTPVFGHGVAGWMRQVGAFPVSQMAALEEVTVSVQRLLNGERFSFHGKHVQMDDVYLLMPPAQVPPILLGVTGPKGLALSGKIAAGTLIPEYCGLNYLAEAQAHIHSGQASAAAPHHLKLYINTVVGDDLEHALAAVRLPLAKVIYPGWIDQQQLTPTGFLPEIEALRAKTTLTEFAAQMPAAWLDALGLFGTVAQIKTRMADYAALGVDELVLVPPPGSRFNLDILETYAPLLA